MVDKRLTIDVKARVTDIQKKMSSWSVEEFLQYFVATLVLGLGLFLLALNTRTFTRKIFFHSYVMDIKMDPTFFSMPATVVSIPCFFLTSCLSFNRRRLFYTLIGLHATAVITTIAGYSVGTKYHPKFSNDSLRLDFTIPQKYINNTLYNFVMHYENNTEFQNSMDRIQSTLKCCGVYSKEDYNTVPTSCCIKSDCQNTEPYHRGCLRSMQEDIAWHRNITISLTQLGILLYLFNAIMAGAVYASYYYRWKDSRKYTE